MGTLRTALRALRNVHDEQMCMWETFYRVSTWDTRPEAPSGSPGLPRKARIQARRPTAAEPGQPDSWPGRQTSEICRRPPLAPGLR